jgi:GntR family transcriptional regulator, N-acetylglucosamine utilization regulator
MRKHEQVRRYVIDALSHELGARDRLPSERALAQQLGVSRPTVRRALDQLAAEGRLQRVQGSGTFARQPPVRAREPSARVLAAREGLAGASRSWRLGVSPREPVWHVERLRLADEVPICLESIAIVKALAPALLDHPLGGSLSDVLAEHYGIDIVRAEQSITATVLEAPTAELLDVPALSPALLVDHVSWDQHGRRVELTQSLFRGDRSAFAMTLRLSPPLRAACE